MSAMNSLKRRSSWLVAGLLVLFAPAVALAQGGAQLVLYEVVESPPPRPSSGGQPGAFIPGPDGSVTRLAQATLSGPVAAASGSLDSWRGGDVQAHAQSRVDLGTGVGPINGVFAVDLTGGGAVPGKLSGTLDLSMLLDPDHPIPLAPVSGTWHTLGKSSVGGKFSGVAQVPVDCGLVGGTQGAFCYVNPDGTVAELQPHEFDAKGVPLVRFLLVLSARR
jgi:hypothetical protein